MKRVLVARPRRQALGLSRALEALGLRVVAAPAIRVAPPSDPGPMRRELRRLRAGERPDVLVLTSANAARAFLGPLGPARASEALRGVRVHAIGPATEAEARAFGLKAKVPKGEHRAETLAAALGDVRGLRVLFPRAKEAREMLPKSLRRAGAEVRVIEAYRTLPDRRGASRLKAALLGPRPVDAAAFTSGSTVESLASLVGPRAFRRVFARIKAVSIGPVTSAALRRRGVEPAAEAKPSTEAGLIRAFRRLTKENEAS